MNSAELEAACRAAPRRGCVGRSSVTDTSPPESRTGPSFLTTGRGDRDVSSGTVAGTSDIRKERPTRQLLYVPRARPNAACPELCLFGVAKCGSDITGHWMGFCRTERCRGGNMRDEGAARGGQFYLKSPRLGNSSDVAGKLNRCLLWPPTALPDW